MTNKVMKVERNVAQAIDLFLIHSKEKGLNEVESKLELLGKNHFAVDWLEYRGGTYFGLAEISTANLIACLKYGYEVDYGDPEEEDTADGYMKTWVSTIIGSFAGRNDGYPTEKSAYFDSIEDMVETYNKHSDEKYYRLEEISGEISRLAEEELAKDNEVEEIKSRRQIEMEIERLQSKLKDLEE